MKIIRILAIALVAVLVFGLIVSVSSEGSDLNLDLPWEKTDRVVYKKVMNQSSSDVSAAWITNGEKIVYGFQIQSLQPGEKYKIEWDIKQDAITQFAFPYDSDRDVYYIAVAPSYTAGTGLGNTWVSSSMQDLFSNSTTFIAGETGSICFVSFMTSAAVSEEVANNNCLTFKDYVSFDLYVEE